MSSSPAHPPGAFLSPPFFTGIPPDVLALSVPVTFAACAFSFVVFRAFAYDPEWCALLGKDSKDPSIRYYACLIYDSLDRTNGITPETEAASKKGDIYRNQIKGFFIKGGQERPSARSM